jgi:hypothetical protein
MVKARTWIKGFNNGELRKCRSQGDEPTGG